jgi:NAD(P)-dependent dehydrogenase (short-subunit alcohol dehydrogenase family)
MRGQQAADKASLESGSQNCFFERLDLSSLESIREFVQNFKKRFNRLDILINNAGKKYHFNALYL